MIPSFNVSFGQAFNTLVNKAAVFTSQTMALGQVQTQVNLDDNLGVATSKADAFGPNTFSLTDTSTWAISYLGSGSSSSSLSAADWHGY